MFYWRSSSKRARYRAVLSRHTVVARMSEPIPEEQQKKFFGRNYYCVYFVNNMVDHNFHGICTVPLPNSTAKLKII